MGRRGPFWAAWVMLLLTTQLWCLPTGRAGRQPSAEHADSLPTSTLMQTLAQASVMSWPEESSEETVTISVRGNGPYKMGLNDDPEKIGGDGVLVESVDKTGLAWRSGIRKDDIILTVNGVPFTSTRSLVPHLRNIKPPLVVTVSRLKEKGIPDAGGKDKKDDGGAPTKSAKTIEFGEDDDIDSFTTEDFKDGLTVVESAGAALAKGIVIGDVLTAINHGGVDYPKVTSEQIRQKLKSAPRPVLLHFNLGALLQGGPKHPHRVVLHQRGDLGFDFSSISGKLVVSTVTSTGAMSGVEAGDILYSINDKVIPRDTSAEAAMTMFEEASVPIALQLNGNHGPSPDAVETTPEGYDKKHPVEALGEPCDDLDSEDSEVGLEERNAHAKKKAQGDLPELVRDYKSDNLLPYTKDSLRSLNDHLYWDTVQDSQWSDQIHAPPMKVEHLKYAKAASEIENWTPEAAAADEKDEADGNGAMAVVTPLCKTTKLQVNQPLKLQTMVKLASKYGWEFNPDVKADDNSEGWKLLSISDSTKNSAAQWRVDRVREDDQGSYRLLSFDTRKQKVKTLSQICAVHVQAQNKSDGVALANSADHDVEGCLDAMNNDTTFFVSTGSDLLVPEKQCSKAVEFCLPSQRSFCRISKEKCDEAIKCRHLIRDCYVDNYFSSKMFAGCYYKSIASPHLLPVSSDASLRSLELDGAVIQDFHPQRFSYSVFISPDANTTRVRLKQAFGARAVILSCSDQKPTPRNDTDKLNRYEWSDLLNLTSFGSDVPEAISSSICVRVTAQDGSTSNTYQVIARPGDPSPSRIYELHVPELFYGFDHDRIYYDTLNAGDRKRLRVSYQETDAITHAYRVLVSLNGSPLEEGNVLDLLPGSNSVVVRLQSSAGDMSPMYRATIELDYPPPPPAPEEDVKAVVNATQPTNGSEAGAGDAEGLEEEEEKEEKDSVSDITVKLPSSGASVECMPAFNPVIIVYECTMVPAHTTNVTLMVETVGNVAGVHINGVASRPNVDSSALVLLPGMNTMDVSIQIEPPPSLPTTYHLYIERLHAAMGESEQEEGGDSAASEEETPVLKLQHVDLHWKNNGHAKVETPMLTIRHLMPDGITSVFMRPTTVHTDTLVELRGNAVHNGHETHVDKPLLNYTLFPGPNRFDIALRSGTSSQVTEYTIILECPILAYEGQTVSRLESLATNADLPGQEGIGALNPPFHPMIFEYHVRLSSEIRHLLIWAAAEDPAALVEVEQQSVPPDIPSLPYPVNDRYEHRVEVRVMAADNVLAHSTVYTVVVRRAASEARLATWSWFYCDDLSKVKMCRRERGDITRDLDESSPINARGEVEKRVHIPEGHYFSHMPLLPPVTDDWGASCFVDEVDGTNRTFRHFTEDDVKPPWFQMTEGNTRTAMVAVTSEDRANVYKVRVVFEESKEEPGLLHLEVRGTQNAVGRVTDDTLGKLCALDKAFDPFVTDYAVEVPSDDTSIQLVLETEQSQDSTITLKFDNDLKQKCFGSKARAHHLVSDRGLRQVITFMITSEAKDGSCVGAKIPEGPNRLSVVISAKDVEDRVYRITMTREQAANKRGGALGKEDAHDARLKDLWVVVGSEKSSGDFKWVKIPNELMEPPFDPHSTSPHNTMSVVVPEAASKVKLMLHSAASGSAVIVSGDTLMRFDGVAFYMHEIELGSADMVNVNIRVIAPDGVTVIQYSLNVDVPGGGSSGLRLPSFAIGNQYLSLYFNRRVDPRQIESGSLSIQPSADAAGSSVSESVAMTTTQKRLELSPHAITTHPRAKVASIDDARSGVSISEADSATLFSNDANLPPMVRISLTDDEIAAISNFGTSDLELVVAADLVQPPKTEDGVDSDEEANLLMSGDESEAVIVLPRKTAARLLQWTALLDSRRLLIFEFNRPVADFTFMPESLTFSSDDGKKSVAMADHDGRKTIEVVSVVSPEKTVDADVSLSQWDIAVFDPMPLKDWTVRVSGQGEQAMYKPLQHPNYLVVRIQDEALHDQLRELSRAGCSGGGEGAPTLTSVQEVSKLFSDVVTGPGELEGADRCQGVWGRLTDMGVTEECSNFIVSLACSDTAFVTSNSFVQLVGLGLIPSSSQEVSSVNQQCNRIVTSAPLDEEFKEDESGKYEIMKREFQAKIKRLVDQKRKFEADKDTASANAAMAAAKWEESTYEKKKQKLIDQAKKFTTLSNSGGFKAYKAVPALVLDALPTGRYNPKGRLSIQSITFDEFDMLCRKTFCPMNIRDAASVPDCKNVGYYAALATGLRMGLSDDFNKVVHAQVDVDPCDEPSRNDPTPGSFQVQYSKIPASVVASLLRSNVLGLAAPSAFSFLAARAGEALDIPDINEACDADAAVEERVACNDNPNAASKKAACVANDAVDRWTFTLDEFETILRTMGVRDPEQIAFIRDVASKRICRTTIMSAEDSKCVGVEGLLELVQASLLPVPHIQTLHESSSRPKSTGAPKINLHYPPPKSSGVSKDEAQRMCGMIHRIGSTWELKKVSIDPENPDEAYLSFGDPSDPRHASSRLLKDWVDEFMAEQARLLVVKPEEYDWTVKDWDAEANDVMSMEAQNDRQNAADTSKGAFKQYVKACQPELEAIVRSILSIHAHVDEWRANLQATYILLTGDGESASSASAANTATGGFDVSLLPGRLDSKMQLQSSYGASIAGPAIMRPYRAKKLQLPHYADLVIRRLLPVSMGKEKQGRNCLHFSSGDLKVSYGLTMVSDLTLQGVTPVSKLPAFRVVTSDTVDGCLCNMEESSDKGDDKDATQCLTAEYEEGKPFATPKGEQEECEVQTASCPAAGSGGKVGICNTRPETCKPASSSITEQKCVDVSEDGMKPMDALKCHQHQSCRNRQGGKCMHGAGKCSSAAELPLVEAFEDAFFASQSSYNEDSRTMMKRMCMNQRPTDLGYPTTVYDEELRIFNLKYGSHSTESVAGHIASLDSFSRCPQTTAMFSLGTSWDAQQCGKDAVISACRMVPDIIDTSGDSFTNSGTSPKLSVIASPTARVCQWAVLVGVRDGPEGGGDSECGSEREVYTCTVGKKTENCVGMNSPVEFVEGQGSHGWYSEDNSNICNDPCEINEVKLNGENKMECKWEALPDEDDKGTFTSVCSLQLTLDDVKGTVYTAARVATDAYSMFTGAAAVSPPLRIFADASHFDTM